MSIPSLHSNRENRLFGFGRQPGLGRLFRAHGVARAFNPPTRMGFGTHVMEAIIRHHMGGDVRLDWRAEGLVCEMVLPMA
jgi:hypothetical protein